MIRLNLSLTSSLLSVAILTGLAMNVGCGTGQSGPPRFQVSGSATYDGKPIPQGEILFVPNAAEGNRGTATLVEIQDGQYATADGNGLIGGAYKIEISGFERQAGVDVDGETIIKPLFRTHSMKNLFPIEETKFDIDVPRKRRR
ncbi:hypothetical protein AB1K70_07825 [Bremerella sp. JC770]|uniref:hypothetical protein n=1 Tax=Bremerella sp. JC770 TaxID=3232137 RepID=UPI003457B2A9